jgi:hypothetical protein
MSRINHRSRLAVGAVVLAALVGYVVSMQAAIIIFVILLGVIVLA